MNSSYQSLSQYKGSMYGDPRYSGLEYDWEVPDNMVDTSPGGTDTTHHHWTKGFYGEGASSGDIYAGQGNRYISGEFGNLYQVGDMAGQHEGYYVQAPDPKFEDRLTSGNPAFRDSSRYKRPIQDPVQRLGINTQKKDEISLDPRREGFELIDTPESGSVVPDPNVTTSTSMLSQKSYKMKLSNPVITLMIAAIIYLILTLFGSASQTFIRDYLHNGKDPTWTTLLYYIVLLIAFLVIILWLLGIPLVKMEKI